MKHLVVPTDFSDTANNALKIAVDLAEHVNMNVIICHVYQYYTGDGFALETIAQMTEQIEEGLKIKLEKSVSIFSDRNVSIDYKLIAGNAVHSFLKESFMENCELIIVGSQGASGIKEIILGSNAEQVIRKAECPVLTIQSGVEEVQMNKVLFASNFLKEIYPAFQRLNVLFQFFKPNLHLLKIITPQHFESSAFSKEIINDFISACQPENYSVEVANEYEVESGIISHARESNSDIIAIATHGNTGISHLISGSIAENIANQSPIPVLSVKIPS